MTAKLATKKTEAHKSKRSFSFSKWFSENKLYLLAFVLPMISMLVVYFFKDLFPFGDLMYLRSDCYHQYAPYLEMLREKLRTGGSLFYTWEIGGGMNFLALSAYYLSSPFNILAVLWPGKMADLVSVFIIVKMGLAGFSTSYYLTKRFGKKSIATVAFGMAYALSAYFAAFSWNIMWLDCMWVLPFIILGLERLVTERKCKMYCIALGLGIFSNYYIGIMLCIYSVIYFVYLFFTVDINDTLNKTKEKIGIIKDYVIYSLLGGGLAACVIIPEYYNLLTTKSADSSFPDKLEKYFSAFYMLFRSLICIPVADLKYPHDPNIFCSLAVFLFIPLFWFCKGIRKKDRIGKTVIAIIMLFSFSFNIPNYIWHGLHFPNSLPCRESFLYIFLLVTMMYEAFLHIHEFKDSQIVASAGVSIGLIFIFEEMFKGAEIFNDLAVTTDITKIIYYSVVFLALYTILVLWYRHKPEYKGFLAYLMILTVFCEMTMNMNVTGMASSSSRSSYYEATDAYYKLNDFAKNQAKGEGINFYRSEEVSHTTRNDGARFRYNSISTFSSVSSAAIQDYYKKIGLQTSFNAYSYYGHTPLTAALFAIKYEYTSGTPSFPDYETLVAANGYTTNTNGTGTINMYQYQNTLPLGFMINSSTMSVWDTETGNPFLTQNYFVTSAVNDGKFIFHKLSADESGNILTTYSLDDADTFQPANNEDMMDVYFFCDTSSDTINASISNDEGSSTMSFSSTNQSYICHVGNVKPNSTISLTTSDGQAIPNAFAYAFDKNAWMDAYNKLSAQPYQVESYSDTKVTGKVTAEADGLLYTSIPYDKGWTAYVDGKKVKTTEICSKALTGVFVKAGTHEVTFKYVPQGFVLGLLLTLLSLAILLCITFKDKLIVLFNKKNSKTNIKA